MAIQAPKGTKDVTPRESYKWQYIEKIARETCDNFGFSEIRTPVIEHTELSVIGIYNFSQFRAVDRSVLTAYGSSKMRYDLLVRLRSPLHRLMSQFICHTDPDLFILI